ncbi:tyrosine-type recombinase/integrase [Azotosporobacter soli]|uniref:tyrosine-type recombinase/integrase n=1 Tax=Azotosporobacter soli TaxID=3055040 RepID=UPI0031FE88EE
METDSELIRRFVTYLHLEKNASPHTVLNYQADIRQFLEFMQVQEVVGEVIFRTVTPMVIRAYQAEMQRKAYSTRTIARRITSLRSMYRFFCREGIMDDNPFLAVRAPRFEIKAPALLTQQEIEEMLALTGPDAIGLRDRAALELLYAAGLRVSELTGLTLVDLELQAGYVLIYGKGTQERMVPIGSAARAAIAAYLTQGRPMLIAKNSECRQERLFLNSRGGSLSDRSIRRIVNRYVKELAWDKKVNPQMLRHSFAAHLLQAGAPAEAVQLMLGHTSMAEVNLYPDAKRANMKCVYQKTHPRA